jgi:hypothetical protein
MTAHPSEEHTAHVDPCCGGWALPGQPTCGACRHHLEPCHRNRTPLQRFDARMADLERTVRASYLLRPAA